jgi:YggT family protein
VAWIVLYYLLEVLKWLIIVRAVLSWFVSPHSDNPVVRLVQRITDPILRPVSEMVPNFGGIDVSPLVAYFAIYLLQMVVVRMM